MNYEEIRDLTIVLFIIILANIVFNNFEKHLPMLRRILKHGLLFIALILVRVFIGQKLFLFILLLLTFGQIILHAWWFPKNGINGLTAKPHDKYLELIKKMKSTKSRNK